MGSEAVGSRMPDFMRFSIISSLRFFLESICSSPVLNVRLFILRELSTIPFVSLLQVNTLGKTMGVATLQNLASRTSTTPLYPHMLEILTATRLSRNVTSERTKIDFLVKRLSRRTHTAKLVNVQL